MVSQKETVGTQCRLGGKELRNMGIGDSRKNVMETKQKQPELLTKKEVRTSSASRSLGGRLWRLARLLSGGGMMISSGK